jgi:putative Mg2+ transporter-C (MgtC) family protein
MFDWEGPERMTTMPLHPTWEDIALRLALTLVAGALIGFNRETHGHAAGLRTTILVCLAASVAMILANLLLDLSGKTDESFVRTDVMRMPLGVLTGVGFIGGGAILRRGPLIAGVTTAATLWMVTVIGLCFGAGAVWLGVAATVLGFIVLWALNWVDEFTSRTQRAKLMIRTREGAPPLQEIREILKPLGCTVRLRGQTRAPDHTETQLDVRWSARPGADPPVEALPLVEKRCKAFSVEWESEAID